MYRPLLLLSYAFNHAVFSDRAWGYLAVNWLIHLGCSFWVWALARILVGRGRGALFCGLLFALHPLAGEPVNYISSRSESLMACFYLGALWAYLQRAQQGWRHFSLGLFGAALLVKSVAITLPVALVLADSYRQGRPRPWRSYGPYGLVAAAYLGLIGANGFLYNSLGAPVRSSAQQLWTQAKAGPYYAKLLLMPWGLSAEHQFFVATHWGQAAVLAGLGLLGSLGWLGWKNRHRLWGFCLLWGGLVLLPASAMPLNVLVNERRLYLSLAGVAWLLGYILKETKPRLLWVVLPCFALLSFQRNYVWKSELSLWSDAVAKGPKMYRSQTNLGKALQLAGRDQEALAAYTRAIAIDSTHGDAYNNIATLLHLSGQTEQALLWYEKALARYPNRPEIKQNLADALGRVGRVDEALSHYQRALQLAPASGAIWNNMGQVLYDAGRLAEAENAFKQALRLMPKRPRTPQQFGQCVQPPKTPCPGLEPLWLCLGSSRGKPH